METYRQIQKVLGKHFIYFLFYMQITEQSLQIEDELFIEKLSVMVHHKFFMIRNSEKKKS